MTILDDSIDHQSDDPDRYVILDIEVDGDHVRLSCPRSWAQRFVAALRGGDFKIEIES